MTVQRLRELQALAEQVEGSLILRFSGDISLDTIIEPTATCGEVHLSTLLFFVGQQHEDGEGWEYHDRERGQSLTQPRILLEDGTSLSIEEAEAMQPAVSR